MTLNLVSGAPLVNSMTPAEMQTEIVKLREALEFYRDPFAWKKLHDPDNNIQVPDFYSETSFGDTAEVALGGGAKR